MDRRTPDGPNPGPFALCSCPLSRAARSGFGVVAMRADWTRPEPQITACLQSFGRYGVPLDVVHGPARPNGEALPELRSASGVLAAMERAMPSPKTLTER